MIMILIKTESKTLMSDPNSERVRGKHWQKTFQDGGKDKDFFKGFNSSGNTCKHRHTRLHKMKSFCTVKETICRERRRPTEQEKVSVNYTSGREVLSRI